MKPLSLLLKASPLIDELSLFDVVGTPGVTADLSHISSVAKVSGYLKENDGLKKALTGADVVVIPAGVPRKPGMTRDDLFNINAGIVRDLITGVAETSPKAFILIISNPVNSTVPIAAEVLKQAGVFDPKRLFGVTTLDVVRAETFVQEITGEKDPSKTVIPVIGGHSGETIVPLFSQAKPAVNIPADKLGPLVHREKINVHSYDTFTESVMKAVKGQKGIVEPSYVYLPGISGGEAIAKETGVDFFSVPIEFGSSGAEKAHNVLTSVSPEEKELLEAAKTGLKGSIDKGVAFVAKSPEQK
ncbi:MAG: hypothetical protein Q9194_000197 [Teloschistes cf. exilis]